MSNDEPSLIEVKFTDEFQRRLRALAKKYRQIRLDIQPILEQLQAGNFVGDRLAEIGYTVFKVRVRNSNIQKGKSAGYRLIYQLSSPTSVILVLIQYCVGFGFFPPLHPQPSPAQELPASTDQFLSPCSIEC